MCRPNTLSAHNKVVHYLYNLGNGIILLDVEFLPRTSNVVPTVVLYGKSVITLLAVPAGSGSCNTRETIEKG